jgi:formylglycine-generating enzyme required for sulfatase activity
MGIVLLALSLPVPVVPQEGSIRVDTPAGTTHEMVVVPAGVFSMGMALGVDDQQNPLSLHEVVLDSFLVDRFEVTIAQWNGYARTTGRTGSPGPGDHPIEGVTWFEADSYCGWAGLRLPTEAEWEKAARGSDGRRYPWGNEMERSLANTGSDASPPLADDSDGYLYAAPVGSYPEGVSPYGAYDMAGNAWEWVSDWYGADHYSTSPALNPTGPASGYLKVLRGGWWHDVPDAVTTVRRYAVDPGDASYMGGIRCARDVQATSPSSLTFENTEGGSVLQKNLSILNIGNGDLVIAGVITEGPDASRCQVAPTAATIAPGGSQTVTVTFTQGMAGSKSATLSIYHNGGNSPTVVKLAGPGAALSLSVAGATGLRKGTVTVPINAAGAQGMAGGELTLSYDTKFLTARQVKGTELVTNAGITVISNLTTAGQVKVSMAGAGGISAGRGALIIVDFEIKSTAPVGTTPLSLQAKLVDENGKVFLSTTEAGAVTVAVLGDVNADGEVNAGDAVLVLRYSAGLLTMTDAQKDVGDVNGDRALNSADAILLLRKLAGLITKFPREGTAKLPAPTVTTAGVRLGEVRALGSCLVEVPVLLEPGVGGGDLLLRYDATDYRLTGIDGSEGLLVASNEPRPGELRLSLARAEAMQPAFVTVRLEGAPAYLAMELEGEAFGVDGEPLAAIEGRLAQPRVCSIGGYPNPFNPATTLRYELAEVGPAQLAIYDVSGAMVRRLVSGWQAAGAYTVVWDGRDEGGRPVASGLYLGCLDSGRMRQAHKLMLLK